MLFSEIKESLILVVDDTTENLDFLTEYLERAGYKTIIALDGQSACDRALKSKPDLILLDVLMPDINGFEVCSKLKENKETKEIPIIFMTALNETIDKLKGFELGAVDFISKPYEPQELLARVRTHLMMKYLKEKLQEMNQGLESKVEERTAELVKTNEELEKEIAERKKTEIQLKDALEKAEEASQLKSAFLMMVSHEIRTPLNAILGFTNILLNENLDEKYLSYLRIIQESGDSLLNIISDIIDISLIETEKLQIYEEPVSIKTIFTKLYYHLDGILDQKKKTVELIYNIPENLDPHIHCDSFRVHQILNNLLLNAVKFTEAGIIEFSVNLVNNELVFSVRDSGIGIPKDKQEQVFDSFRQADMSDSRKFGGLGLGLTIAKKLVEIMNGRIWLESEAEGEKHGTTISFTLPYKPVEFEPEEDRVILSELNKLQSKKILIVEDDNANQELIKQFLKTKGIQTTLASNGKQAVSAFENDEDIDLILMDIQMPVMDGYEAVEIIRSIEKSRSADSHIPIIALTAAALQQDKEKCLSVGCDDHLAKPVNRNGLLEKVEKFLT